jgi:hypothetical protein
MADVRLMIALLAGCSAADAQPSTTSGLTPPAGWQPLPAVATAARVAAGAPGITVDGAEAWGEPAMGCYAVWIALHGGNAGPDELTKDIVDGLATEKINATVERQPGRLHGGEGACAGCALVDSQITALACVANQRGRRRASWVCSCSGAQVKLGIASTALPPLAASRCCSSRRLPRPRR